MTDQHSSTVTESAHTPTPWRLEKNYWDRDLIVGGPADPDCETVITTSAMPNASSMRANADLIVKAVNAHADLVRTLADIEALAVCVGVVDPKQHVNMLSNIARLSRAALSQVRP